MNRDLVKAGPADMVLHRQASRRAIRGFGRERLRKTKAFPGRLASRGSGVGVGQFRGGLPVMLKRLGRMQTTLRRQTALSGVGVHSGEMVHMTLLPAEAGCGVSFTRTDLEDGRSIPADHRFVCTTDHSTSIAMNGASIATIEHLMAALSALEVDNAVIEVDGPELPVMDGSSAAFIDAVDQAGIVTLPAPRRYIKVLKPVRAEVGRSVGELRPYDGTRIEIEIDFEHGAIGRQVFAADIDPAVFRRELGRARTFGFLADVEKMWANGLALGASLENSIVIGPEKVINPDGLRFADEFVRHKALDALGDLALAGAPILGRYRSYRGGHKLNKRVLEELFADPDAWTFVESPVRAEAGYGELPALVGAVAYKADAS
jgi:UDP-3-O-[3-hydroxymyristoyl] N-acetylglucosamine deacetylase